MRFLNKIINAFKETTTANAQTCPQSIPLANNKSNGTSVPKLTADGTGPHAKAEHELLQLLCRVISDSKIDQLELKELSEWFRINNHLAENIPAIPFLWRFIQSALNNDDIDSFERAMIRAAINKVLPEIQTSNEAVETEPINTTPTPVPTNNSPTGAEWVIIDTETSGLLNPIYAVEIAAQTMKGFSPIGPAFRVFINHNIDLEPAAIATHGYTREFLRQKGLPPREAHCKLAAYAGGLPMVSHNLAYDFKRVLSPEWKRLGMAEICPPAFCTVMLSRRCLPEVTSVSLDKLARHFDLGTVSHQAIDDVTLTVSLLSSVLAPRLTTVGIEGVPALKEFARKTPLIACHEIIGGKPPKSNTSLPRKKRLSHKVRRLKSFIQEIISDGQISNYEFETLQQWIETEGITSREAERVVELIEKILHDGQVSTEELEKLTIELSEIAA
jgi:DNA polymerase III epsilon subunit-like protein